MADNGFSWDAGAGRYRGPDGRFVARAAIRQAVDAVIEGAQIEIQYHCDTLAAGGTLAEWQTAMGQTIRSLHTAVAAAGKGGWAAMGPADWGRVGALTKIQYQYLAGFAGEIAGGKYDLQAGALATRAKMYAGAAVLTYEQTSMIAALQAPALQREYNVLGEADHCDDCLAATSAGRVPIGTLSRPGSRQCRGHCQCRIEFA